MSEFASNFVKQFENVLDGKPAETDVKEAAALTFKETPTLSEVFLNAAYPERRTHTTKDVPLLGWAAIDATIRSTAHPNRGGR